MNDRHRVVRSSTGPPTRSQRGSLSLEAVLVLPILALVVVGLLEVAGFVRDVLLVHEAARAAVRTAATTSGREPVVAAARDAAPELSLEVVVDPPVRGDGDLVSVVVHTDRRVGPANHRLSARTVARVEPAVGTIPGQAPRPWPWGPEDAP